ncbi:RNA polymerase, sigma subunit, SigV [Paenibacillus uliginis N3/975]|uniref:RNA polymerase, sigma subunit, SigV n=1 Tax=Paenibacillus uliginis N3/975 TaxID=1313296 RepID=A0A1X7HR94_9BACL|nr:sigma-70 family RNA polymerase sigma factor [Paenibacillus uliginis]SMF91364.1 RNA polymerase, sigma subunit, SigV [Paenibacillus uliginis N3/975]
MEERELAAAACRGDEAAFHALITGQRRRLYGIAYSYLHNENDALEAVQETVCRAWSKCGRLRNPEVFVSWLIRILINCCVDEQKRRKRVVPYEEISVTSTGEMINDSKLDLERALNRMKPKYRHVLILKYYQDMTVTEIAKVLDCPEGTVKTRLHQGLKLLRQKMKPGGAAIHV